MTGYDTLKERPAKYRLMNAHWNIQGVEEIPEVDEHSLKNLVSIGRPALLRGMVNDWEALHRWNSPDYLKAKLQNSKVPVYLFEHGSFDDAERTCIDMPFGEFSGRFLTWENDQPQLAKMNAKLGESPEFEPISGDFFKPPSLPNCFNARLFLGKDYASQIHYHAGGEALLCTAAGSKRVFLFKPTDFHRLYPFRWNRDLFTLSRMIFEFDDLKFDIGKYPKAQGLEVLEATVAPGDSLYIPMYWPHLVYSYGISISVTYFWRASLWRKYTNPLLLRGNHFNMMDFR